MSETETCEDLTPRRQGWRVGGGSSPPPPRETREPQGACAARAARHGYKPTVEEMHQGDFSVAGVSLTLDILDTSGAYEFPAMRALSISSADAFILVYDITDAATFDEARALRDQILETKAGAPAPIVVVGNKLDLADDAREVAPFRPPNTFTVEYDTTESVVTVDWENGFVECSAKDNVNVAQVFKELLTQAKVKYNLSPALRKRRRQSLPRHSISEGPGGAGPHIPSPAQLQHLQQIRERHSGSKRNSCVVCQLVLQGADAAIRCTGERHLRRTLQLNN
ncbi:Ras-related protein Rap1 [Gryllus bimaculatus]|nr:Ras-related protein Rap1 [Gryllus bimaculatus]